jgi:hypothetical protein
MNRDHLRLVTANSAPCRVSLLESFSFAQVEGGMVILHNDKRISAPEALEAISKLLKPALIAHAAANADPLSISPHGGKGVVVETPRRRLPGDMGGDGLEAAEDPLFAENRHKRGYPAERPRPICAETVGDMA